MNNKIYITGHKNPDTDSVCSALAYAYLKSCLDNKFEYIPIICGTINKQTRFIFNKLNLQIPELITDIRARVKDVTRIDYPQIDPWDTVYKAIEELDSHNVSVLPVIDEEAGFLGLLSIHEIMSFLIQDNDKVRPRYLLSRGNFSKVLPGHFYKTGSSEEFDVPIMIGAMPYDICVERVNQIQKVKPLMITGMRLDLLEYAVENNFPGVILTGCENENLDLDIFKEYEGCVYVSYMDTAETARRLRLSVPVMRIMNSNPDKIDAETFFDSARDMLVNSSYRGLPVLEKGSYLGLVSRRCFIEKPKNAIVMVDHNEIDQSIKGANEAEIVEIIDHHRLGSIKTKYPIMMDVRPLGSTCSIVYDHFIQNRIDIPVHIARLLLSGIISDTVVLKSPTVTEFDKRAARDLAEISGMNLYEWGNEILKNGSSLITDDYKLLITNDIKHYKEYGYSISIAQVEVVTFDDMESIQEKLMDSMKMVMMENGLDWLLLLVTNIVKQDSILVVTPNSILQDKLVFDKKTQDTYYLKGVLSRKKQLLPEVLRVLEENRRDK